MHKFIIIFFVGMLGIWKAVPAGFLMKAPPLVIWMMTASGASSSVIIICLSGNWFKSRFLKKERRSTLRRTTRGKAILEKYGIAGLGFLGTILMGPNFAAIIGMVFSEEHKKLLVWTVAGIIFWTAVLTVAATYSLELITSFSLRGLFR